jgi:hypothetical protein
VARASTNGTSVVAMTSRSSSFTPATRLSTTTTTLHLADIDRSNLVTSNVKSNNLWTVGLTAPIGRGTLGIELWPSVAEQPELCFGWRQLGCGHPCTPIRSPSGPPSTAAYSYFSNDNNVRPSRASAIAVPGNGVGALGESNYALGAGLTPQLLKSRRSAHQGKWAPRRPFSCHVTTEQIERTTEEQTSLLASESLRIL